MNQLPIISLTLEPWRTQLSDLMNTLPTEDTMKRILATGGTSLVIALAMGCGDVNISGPDEWPPQPPPSDPTTDVSVTSEWRGQIAPGKQIEIKGINGDINAVPAAGSEVVVTATRRGKASAVEEVTIDVVSHPLGVTICAVYPDVPGQQPNVCVPGDGGNMSVFDGGRGVVRVTFTVRVPDGVVVIGKALTGDIEATGLRSDAFLSTLSGDVRVSTTRLATAKTLNGSIIASIGMRDWGRDLEFRTMAGDVEVTVPAQTNAWVEAGAQSGRVTSDFPLSRVSPGQLEGAIGSGGPTLTLATLRGDLALRRGQ